MLDQSLITYLQKTTGLQVHRLVLPEGYTLPAVVYQRNTRMLRTSHDGRRSGMSTVTLAVWAVTFAAAADAVETISQKMMDWQTSAGQTVRQESSAVDYDPGVNFFRGALTFQVFFEEV